MPSVNRDENYYDLYFAEFSGTEATPEEAEALEAWFAEFDRNGLGLSPEPK